MISDAAAAPEVSVVLAVYNAPESVVRSIESVLEQTGPGVELIVVDDGSTDSTFELIERAVKSAPNVISLRNDTNQGLTESLVRGCARARGRYIARIDAGDRFLPGRIDSQYRLLESQPDVGLVSCGTRFLSAEGEVLYDVCQKPRELSTALQQTTIKSVRGPSHHGSTMFRRSVYEAVGGYRAAFRVAQDLDLWMRMCEVAEVLAMPEILYESTIFPDSISVRQREQQIRTTGAILEGARRRRRGESEPDFKRLLLEAELPHKRSKRDGRARYEYFVGACLWKRDKALATEHLQRAWAYQPWSLRYGLRYLVAISLSHIVE